MKYGLLAVALLIFTLPAALPAQQPYLVKDIFHGLDSSSPNNLFDDHGVLFFGGTGDPHVDTELWRSDGSPDGTFLVKDIHPMALVESNPRNFVHFDGIVYFSASGPDGRELWRTDGTGTGTSQVRDIATQNPSQTHSKPHGFVALDDVLLFIAISSGALNEAFPDGSSADEFWKTDGTEAGTMRVLDTNPNGEDQVSQLTRLGDQVFFGAADGVSDVELWKSDGTPGGTMRLRDINASGSSFPVGMTAFGGEIFFSAQDASGDRELWKSDGTEDGTVRVADLWSGGSSTPLDLTTAEGLLFFTAIDDDGRELWKTDGTPGGTVLVRDINSGGGSSLPIELTNVDGTLFFSASNGVEGVELWKSDGTENGTVQVLDVVGNSFPGDLTPFDSVLYFAADGDVNGIPVGRELWKTDGTEEGTVVVRDFNPGIHSSNPTFLTASGGRLFFQTDEHNGLGRELYALDGNLPHIANISTRGFVGLGDNVMIAGIIIEGARKRVIVRAIGPALDEHGVPHTLNDPTLQVFSGATSVAFNDNWSEGDQAAEIIDSGLQPGFTLESAIIMELDPGPYTAIVRGAGGTIGNAIVEVFELD